MKKIKPEISETREQEVNVRIKCCVCLRENTRRGWRHRLEDERSTYTHTYCPECYDKAMSDLERTHIADSHLSQE